VEQAAMAEFMRDGHFERHVRHVRSTYLQRQQHLVAEAHRYLSGRLTVEPADAGMEVIAWLQAKDNDVAVTETIRREGVEVVPLSPIVMERRLRPGLILGYSGLSSREITEGIQCIARAMERYKRVV
jgi:GntR family transcriptional regulator/MocR family aminotransferase